MSLLELLCTPWHDQPTHPECVHYDGPPGHTHGDCCICQDSPCELVTVEQMRDHRRFDIAIWSGVA